MGDRNDNRSERPNRPAFVLLVYHTENPKERPTEVGALWPLKDGKGFSVTIKRGLALSTPKAVRAVCLPVTDNNSNRPRVGGNDD